MGSLTPQPEEQPLDPDLPGEDGPGADWLTDRWESTRLLLLLIFVGSSSGTAIRAVIEEAHPTSPGGWPWATFGINVVGSLLLAAILQTLARTGDDVGWRRAARLGLGTGVLGGFTTYSTFVLEIGMLADAGRWGLSAVYGVGSAVLGIAAAGAGIWLVNRIHWSPVGQTT